MKTRDLQDFLLCLVLDKTYKQQQQQQKSVYEYQDIKIHVPFTILSIMLTHEHH